MGLWFVHAPSAFRRSEEADCVWERIIIWVDTQLPASAHSSLDLVLLSAWRLSRQENLPVTFRWIRGDSRPEDSQKELAELEFRARIPGSETEIIDTTLVEALKETEPESLHLVVKDRPHDWDGLLALTEACRGFMVLACLSGEAECQ